MSLTTFICPVVLFGNNVTTFWTTTNNLNLNITVMTNDYINIKVMKYCHVFYNSIIHFT